MNTQEDNMLYKCDTCPATFDEEAIKKAAKEEPGNFNIWGASVLILDGKKHLLACPECGKMHFFGFGIVKEETPRCTDCVHGKNNNGVSVFCSFPQPLPPAVVRLTDHLRTHASAAEICPHYTQK